MGEGGKRDELRSYSSGKIGGEFDHLFFGKKMPRGLFGDGQFGAQ